MVSAPEASRSPFAYPLFRSVWAANLVSNLGYMIHTVGAAWLMTELSSSPRMVALVLASVSLPIMTLALFTGAIADNFDRRRVMLFAQFFMLAVSGILAAVSWAGWISPYLLLVCTFMIGCGMALNGPAWQASVGDMVPKAALPSAVAYNSVAFNVARSAGPALGGAIVATAGAAAAFMANCLSGIGLIAVLMRWRPPPREYEMAPERIVSAIASGLRYGAMSPNLLRVMVRAAMFAVPSSAITALMPLVARDLLGGGAITYGLLLGAFGVGAVGGALASAPLRERTSAQMVVGIAATAVALGAAGVALSGGLFTALPALAMAGAGWILAMSTLNVTVQLATPRWVVARALSLYQMASFGGLALGSTLFGSVAANWGIRDALLLAAALQGLTVVAGLALRLPRVDDLNLDPLRRWSEPSTELPIEASSGPVSITIAYRIDPADVAEFLRLMREHRRVRRRDGARRWALSRDLADPGLWIERYHVPTWLEYVRHNQRRTRADAANSERIRSLHRGEGPPAVQRVIEVQPGSRSGGDLDPTLLGQPLPDHP